MVLESSGQLLSMPVAAVFRLFLGQLAAYPLLLVYQRFFRRCRDPIQHTFLTASGLALSYWSIGEDALVHACVTLTGNYLIIRCASARVLVPISAAFNLGYLIAGYLAMTVDGFDTTWTIPQSGLCLRMIGEQYIGSMLALTTNLIEWDMEGA